MAESGLKTTFGKDSSKTFWYNPSSLMYNYLEIKIFNIIRTKITVGDKLPRCNYYYKFKSRACQSVLPGKIFFNKNIWRLIKDTLQWNFFNNKANTEELVSSKRESCSKSVKQ